MKSKLYCKILAVGIICLFVGMGMHPVFAVDTKQSIVTDEEDCGCNEVDDRQLVVLEKQLNRLEVYSKLLLVLSKHNHELREISEELLDGISTLKEELTDEPPFPILCEIFYALYKGLGPIFEIIIFLEENYPNLREILYLIGAPIIISFYSTMLGVMLFCGIDPYPLL